MKKIKRNRITKKRESKKRQRRKMQDMIARLEREGARRERLKRATQEWARVEAILPSIEDPRERRRVRDNAWKKLRKAQRRMEEAKAALAFQAAHPNGYRKPKDVA